MFLALLLLPLGCERKEPAPSVTVPVQEPILVVRTAEAVSVPTAIPTAQPTPEPTATPTQEPTPTPAPTEEELLWRYIDGMTWEEKLGQLCMFGFSGTSRISEEFAEMMRAYHIGCVILYGQNIKRDNSDGGFSQCRKLTDSIRGASDSEIPLLISTDVEGGSVTRFHWSKTLDSARTLGTKNDPDRARREFAYIGEGLQSAGINVDLAPVLDVAKKPDSHFMGKRIVSSRADVACDIGLACIEGLHEGGVLSIVKHFPGHGATNTDSHESTPEVDKSIDALRGYELIPFEAALTGGADGVMVAHILYTAIDDRVASQSEVFITDLIRGEYGFDGIVMSDDFRMAGLRKQTSLDKAAVRFLLAGGDLILCGANHSYQKKILEGLYGAYRDGRLSEERINESVYRILSAKLRVTDWRPTGAGE